MSSAAGLHDKVLTFDMCSCYRHMHPQLVLVGEGDVCSACYHKQNTPKVVAEMSFAVCYANMRLDKEECFSILKSYISILKSSNLFFFSPTGLSIEEAISLLLVVIKARNKQIVKVF